MNLFCTIPAAAIILITFLKKEATAQPVSGEVIGGTVTDPGRYPYQVSIGRYCGGFLVAPDLVLTAAHCAGGGGTLYVGAHDFSVTRRLNTGGKGEGDEKMKRPKLIDKNLLENILLPADQIFTASEYEEMFHPDYDSTTDNLDQAFLKLSRTVTTISPVQIDDFSGTITDALVQGDPLQVIGWGDTMPGDTDSSSDILMEATVGFVP